MRYTKNIHIYYTFFTFIYYNKNTPLKNLHIFFQNLYIIKLFFLSLAFRIIYAKFSQTGIKSHKFLGDMTSKNSNLYCSLLINLSKLFDKRRGMRNVQRIVTSEGQLKKQIVY